MRILAALLAFAVWVAFIFIVLLPDPERISFFPAVIMVLMLLGVFVAIATDGGKKIKLK